MEQKWIIVMGSIIVGLAGLVGVLIAISSAQVDKYAWGPSEPQIGHYWTCMEGCWGMQQVMNQSYGTPITEENHRLCSDWCWIELNIG